MLTASSWLAEVSDVRLAILNARKTFGKQAGALTGTEPRVGFLPPEARVPTAEEAAKHDFPHDPDGWLKLGRRLNNLHPALASKLARAGEDAPPSFPLSFACKDYSDLSEWLSAIDLAHARMAQLTRDPAYNVGGWADTQLEDLQKFIPQNGRWKTWWITKDFHNTTPSKLDRHAVDLIMTEVATYWPEDGSLLVPLRTGKGRGWPTYGKGQDDQDISLLMYLDRETRVAQYDRDITGQTYLGVWHEIIAQSNKVMDQGDILRPIYVTQTRTGLNGTFRPEFEVTPTGPRLTGMARGRRPRSRHVEGDAYGENRTEIGQGYAFRHAAGRSYKLHDVYHHGDGPSVATKVLKYRQAVANYWRIPLHRVTVIGLDVKGMDKAWSEEDQEIYRASEAAHLPYGQYYRGPIWRKHRMSKAIVVPPMWTGDAGFEYTHRGYNSSGIGTTDTDNNIKLLANLMRALVKPLRLRDVDHVWATLGYAWMAILKGDDTGLIVPDWAVMPMIAAGMAEQGMEVTDEGAVFLARSMLTGFNKASSYLIKEASPEWFRPTKDPRLYPISQADRVRQVINDPAFRYFWGLRRTLPLAFASIDDLEMARADAVASIEADATDGESASPQVYDDLLDMLESSHRGDVEAVIQAALSLGLTHDMLKRRYKYTRFGNEALKLPLKKQIDRGIQPHELWIPLLSELADRRSKSPAPKEV